MNRLDVIDVPPIIMMCVVKIIELIEIHVMQHVEMLVLELEEDVHFHDNKYFLILLIREVINMLLTQQLKDCSNFLQESKNVNR